MLDLSVALLQTLELAQDLFKPSWPMCKRERRVTVS